MNPQNTLASIPNFKTAHILVMGDVMLDRYWQGSSTHISNEAPVPIVQLKKEDDRLGGAANTALNARMLGASVTLLGIIGEDDIGRIIKKKCESAGIKTILKKSHKPSILKLRVVSKHQQLIRIDNEYDFEENISEQLIKPFENEIKKCDVIVLSDYNKGTITHITKLINLAHKCNKPILIDPVARDFSYYEGATLLTPNYQEFLAGIGLDERHPSHHLERGIQKIHQHHLGGILLTEGSHGMTLLKPGENPLHLNAQAQDVFDVTGAGDTVIATVATALAAGATMLQAMQLSNLAAASVVAKFGTSYVTANELRTILKNKGAFGTGIMTQGQLLNAVKLSKENGRRIVMTNGCFDLLHSGHITYLTKAKTLGDRLIVAINDDESVRRLKGEERPIIPLEERMNMIAALSCVDWVVSFSEDTPEKIITAVMPNVLVKGSDYTKEEIAGAKAVIAHGGSVEIIPLLPGHSTTQLINKIQHRPY